MKTVETVRNIPKLLLTNDLSRWLMVKEQKSNQFTGLTYVSKKIFLIITTIHCSN